MVRKGIIRVFHYLNLTADTIAVVAALLAGYFLRFSGWPIPVMHEIPDLKLYLKALPVIVLVVVFCFHYAGLYLQRRGISGVDEFSRITRTLLVAFLILIGLTYFYQRVTYSRVVLIYTWGISLILIALLRSVLRRVQIILRRKGIGVVRVLLLGLTSSTQLVADNIRRYPGLGYRLLGIVAETTKPPKKYHDLLVLGKLKDLASIIKRNRAEAVIIALPATAYFQLESIMLMLENSGVECKIVSDLFGIITNPMSVDEIYGIPVFALKESPLSSLSARFWKRVLDLSVALPGIIVLSPLLLAIALAIKITSPGPVFYRQERVGRDNQPFMVMKFRSMRQDAERETGPVWAKRDDSRTTAVGAFLRKTSLDEFAQLFNVIKGEMSLVGPRPERPHFVDQFKTSIPRYLERHKVKAGITGWAQAHNLRGNTPIEERTKYDLWYVENWSLILDIKIIIRTALDIFHHQDAY
jgi:exopolysaccharide biosynthesis polyprenyl glycosylphosphotransferase